MKVMAVAATKGGSCKSTLCANLGVRAERDGPTVLVDYDPQLSLCRWRELRTEEGGPSVIEGCGDGAVVDVRRLRGKADWVLLDIPPATQHLIRTGIKAADLVLIPVKTSPLDLEAIDPVLELCEEHRKPFAFVVAMFDPKWRLAAEVFPYLERKAPGRVLREVFSYRQAYVGSMIAGHTGPEYNADARQARAARDEVDALWAAIRKRLGA